MKQFVHVAVLASLIGAAVGASAGVSAESVSRFGAELIRSDVDKPAFHPNPTAEDKRLNFAATRSMAKDEDLLSEHQQPIQSDVSLPPAPLYGLEPGVLFYAQLIFGLGAIASVLYCISRAVMGRTMTPIYILLGGALCSLYEAYADRGGLAIYPEIGIPISLDELGRKIPLYVLFIYLFFFPAPFILLMEQFKRGMAYRNWVTICAVAFTSSAVFEFLPLHYKLWNYYGHYPFVILEHPIVWAFMNGQSVLSVAVCVHLILKVLPTSLNFLLIAAVPLMFFGIHFAVAMPTYTVLNSTTDPAVIRAGVLLTIAMAIALPLLLGRLVTAKSAHEGV